MRVIVVGLGVQGHKRRRFAGADCRRLRRLRSIREADYRAICARCRSTRYDAALLCIPDAPKIELLGYLRRARQARARRKAAGRRRTRQRLDAAAAARARQGRRAATPPTTTASSRTSCACAISSQSGALGTHLPLPHVLRQRHGAARARLRLARPGRRRARPISARTCSTPARFWFGDIGERFSLVIGRPLREPRARPRRVRGRRRAARSSSSK